MVEISEKGSAMKLYYSAVSQWYNYFYSSVYQDLMSRNDVSLGETITAVYVKKGWRNDVRLGGALSQQFLFVQRNFMEGFQTQGLGEWKSFVSVIEKTYNETMQ